MGQIEDGRRLNRRSLLTVGAAAATTAGIAIGAATGTLPMLNVFAGERKPTPTVLVDKVHSKARDQTVTLVTVAPTTGDLPVCLFLHGLRGDARRATPGGLAENLTEAVAAGRIPPFAVVSVDGGDNYWHENHVGDNAMAMLLDEMPGWLRERGLGGPTGRPFACAGVSMGGFGALLYARRRNERADPLNAVAAISPGLLTSWREMSTRRAFRDTQDWAAHDPLRNVDKLGGVPVGIWCGTEDHFIEGARRFIRLAKPAVGFTGPGTHGDDFYRTVTPSVLDFLGRHVRG